MSILKALQRKQSEQTNETELKVSATVVPFEKNGKRTNQPPDIFIEKEFKIGTPSLAFNGQSDSAIGTALPDTETKPTAGATLNADGATPSAEKRFPEFASWSVEAERVEPRLVAITHPHSNYCEEYRSLRTQILHKSQRQKLQSIVVASVNPSEGKSVTAVILS